MGPTDGPTRPLKKGSRRERRFDSTVWSVGKDGSLGKGGMPSRNIDIMVEKVLIAGLGSIGQRHLRLVRERLPDAEIMVLRHRASNDRPEYADRVTESMDEALAFAPQVAVIANPAPMHLAVAEALLDARCHMLIEKPMATEAAAAASFLKRLPESTLVCQVGYNLRFLPSLTEFRRLVNEGVAGRTLSIRAEIGQYLPDWRPGKDYRDSVSAKRELGGGVLLELSHEFDYLGWVFGDVEWVSAWASHVSDLELDVEDCAHLVMGFATRNQVGETVATLSMDLFRRDTLRTCTMIGSEGSLRWNPLAGSVELHKAGGSGWETVFTKAPERDQAYRAQLDHFLDCVRTGGKPLVDAAAGLRALDTVEAARRSMASDGQRCKVRSSIEKPH
jgi:predicted dehydrogenase